MNAITVVIPNWNGMEVIKPCLDSLRSQSMKAFSTILIDNGSTDGSLELVRRVSGGQGEGVCGEYRIFAGGQ